MRLSSRSLIPLLLALAVGALMLERVASGEGFAVRGSGHLIDAARTLPTFSRVELDGSIDVHVDIGDRPTVIVHADDNIVPKVLTEVSGDTLHVRIAPHSWFESDHEAVVKIVMPRLDAARVHGSGDITIRGVDGGKLALDVLGSGDIVAQGRVDELQARIQGSGDLRLAGLTSQNAKVSVNGSGDAKVHVVDTLDAEVTGSGDVNYVGRPRNLNRSVTGSGSVSGE